jgi:predicted NUDIX family phosphoesterase
MPIDEQILVIPESLLLSIGKIEGFCTDVERFLNPILASEQLSFRPRREMESDPSFKQLIPYIILRHVDTAGQTHIFTYTRGSGQGEKRLHAKRSIGIGGHISEEDAAGGSDPYLTGMQRELTEEVVIDANYQERRVGLIYDPSTDVGRVHLGVVHVFDLDQPLVQPNEEDISETGFVPVDELRHQRDSLEVWSQLCLDSLFQER